MSAALEAALSAAHGAGDGRALARLYGEAAAGREGPERAFLLTQAMVFALEAGDPAAEGHRAALVAMGCEAPLAP